MMEMTAAILALVLVWLAFEIGRYVPWGAVACRLGIHDYRTRKLGGGRNVLVCHRCAHTIEPES